MYLGCLTMSNARSMHCIFHHKGRVKPGRQRTLLLTYIQHLLRDTDMIDPDKLSELAQNRCGWKKIVVACSADDDDIPYLAYVRRSRDHDWSVTWSLIQIT